MKRFLITFIAFGSSLAFAKDPPPCAGRSVPQTKNGEVVGYACETEDLTQDLLRIYAKLNLLVNKDTLVKANADDFLNPNFFTTMVDGFHAGNLCVQYRRDEKYHRACYSKVGTKEKVSDRLI